MLIRDVNEYAIHRSFALKHLAKKWNKCFFGGLLFIVHLLPELIGSLFGYLRPKRSWLSEVVSDCAFVLFTDSLLELPLFRTEGIHSEGSFCNNCRLISKVRLRSARLCGKGDCCLLSVQSALQLTTVDCEKILRSDNWHSHGKPRKLRINFKTEARKFKVWNIRIDDSQRKEDEIHLGLQHVQKGWVSLNFSPEINYAIVAIF